jgi:hypothetical protein
MKKAICVFLGLNLMFLAPATAQDEFIQNTQRDAMIVAGATAGGAVLGLSTLSFVDTPSRHISNIWTGAALGLIGGVLIVAYYSAQKGSEELISAAPSADFDTSERTLWHQKHNQLLTFKEVQFGTPLWHSNF